MTNYQYIVLPVQGEPYKVSLKQGENELSFLQDKVGGYIQEIRSPLDLHPLFNQNKWKWVEKLLYGKTKFKVYANENGLTDCVASPVLYINSSWFGLTPVMGNVVIKMTKKNFDKIKGKVYKNFEEMEQAYEL